MTQAAVRDQSDTVIRYIDPAAKRNETVSTVLGEFTGLLTLGETAATEGSKVAYKERRARIAAPYEITLHDARGQNGSLSAWDFEVNGFIFADAPTPIPDFHNEELLSDDYVPLAVEIVKRATGARRAFSMGHHQVRTEATGRTTSQTSYARFAHTDYGPAFESHLRRLMEGRFNVPRDEASTCGLCLAGFWTPIERPAYKDPLCLLDAQSIDLAKETVPYIYTGISESSLNDSNRSFDEYIPTPAGDAPAVAPIFSSAHRWIYAPDMTPDEAVVFKQYDMRPNATSKVCFHSSFRDRFHEDWQDCPGRRSVEVRVLLTF